MKSIRYRNGQFLTFNNQGSESKKVNDAIFERFEQIIKTTSLNKTEVIKGLILLINEEVLQNPLKKRMSELETVLLASA